MVELEGKSKNQPSDRATNPFKLWPKSWDLIFLRRTGFITIQARMLHITEVFVACDRAASKGAIVDRIY